MCLRGEAKCVKELASLIGKYTCIHKWVHLEIIACIICIVVVVRDVSIYLLTRPKNRFVKIVNEIIILAWQLHDGGGTGVSRFNKFSINVSCISFRFLSTERFNLSITAYHNQNDVAYEYVGIIVVSEDSINLMVVVSLTGNINFLNKFV